MKRSELKEIILEVVREYYEPKVNKEKETITFVNDAEVKRAVAQLKKKKIDAEKVGKTLKFINTHAFKEAQKILK